MYLNWKVFFLFWKHRNAECIMEQIKTTQIVKFLFDDLSGLFDSSRNEGRKTNRLKSKLEKNYQSNCPNQIKWIVFHSLSNKWTNFIIDLSTIGSLSFFMLFWDSLIIWTDLKLSFPEFLIRIKESTSVLIKLQTCNINLNRCEWNGSKHNVLIIPVNFQYTRNYMPDFDWSQHDN